MPLNPKLLEILVCPEDKSALTYASEALLAQMNSGIERGIVTNRGGRKVTERVEEGLVRADGRVLYPVREGIPVMLIDESIPIEQLPV